MSEVMVSEGAEGAPLVGNDRKNDDQPEMSEQQHDQQVAALLEAISLVSRLAAMDPERYMQESKSTSVTSATVNGNGNGCCSRGENLHDASPSTATDGDDNSPSSTTSSSLSTIQCKIDALQTTWALEDTAIPSLAESIHRLQANISLLEKEADMATSEIQDLQTKLVESKSREKRLERAVRKLFAENEKLRERLAKRRQKSKAFVRNVKDAVGSMKVLKRRDEDEIDGDAYSSGDIMLGPEERDVVNQLKRHESALKESKRGSSSSKGGIRSGSDPSMTPDRQHTRQRTLTDSSLFSDIDESAVNSPFRNYNYDFDFDSCDASTDTTDEEDEGSVTSSCSAPLVTAGVSATVSLKPTNSFPPSPAQIDSSTLEEDFIIDEGESKKPSNVYHLRFPVGRRVGIELQRVPLVEREDVNVRDTSSFPLADDSAHSYEYTFADAAVDVSSDIKALGSFLGKVGKSALLGLPSDDAREQELDESQHPDSAFLICGFAGFDSILNKRPPIGCRLIAIDDVSLERGSWTFARLKACIQEKSSETRNATTFTMTFRTDPLSNEQRDILEKAVAFAEKTTGREESTDDSQSDEFLLVPSEPKPVKDKKSAEQGSSHSGSGGRSKAERRKITEGKKAPAPPPPPGPEEVKMAIKAFSNKFKSIM